MNTIGGAAKKLVVGQLAPSYHPTIELNKKASVAIRKVVAMMTGNNALAKEGDAKDNEGNPKGPVPTEKKPGDAPQMKDAMGRQTSNSPDMLDVEAMFGPTVDNSKERPPAQATLPLSSEPVLNDKDIFAPR